MQEGFSSSDLKVPKQCNAFPDNIHFPARLSSRKTKVGGVLATPQKSHIMQPTTSQLTIDRNERTRKVSSSHANRFSLPNRIERTSKNRGNSYEGHQINAVSSPYDTSPQARGNYDATMESSDGSESDRKLLIVREMSIEGEQCQI